MTLKQRYNRVDALRHQLNRAERDLKADIAAYARSQGLLANPRPETLRAQLGL